jgi:four helix bundle protein
MAKYASFRELIVWQKGMDLAEKVHRATRPFPSADLFTHGTQLPRAANSIPANVAEGFSRRSRRVYRAHVAIALGSTAEVQTQLELCRRLSLVDRESIETRFVIWNNLLKRSAACFSGCGGLFS